MSTMINSRRDEMRLREDIVKFRRSLFERGLTSGSSGNISVRQDDGLLLTPTNACLGRLDPARLAKLDWDGRLQSGDAPSKEAFLHRDQSADRRPYRRTQVNLQARHLNGSIPCQNLPPT
jgi:ribulose-5-phosphate 4-epimerase/fuculose-1-phosphate aldolase